jgi:tetratricopeptide (TPR) repeat protein
MVEGVSFPGYVQREAEERAIFAEVERVRAEENSRAVLLYGEGGIGKTQLIRALVGSSHADRSTVWLEPIDVDDSEYWLLSNLETKVACQLDPENHYFGPYYDYLSRLPEYAAPRSGHEAVVSHLGRIKRVFIDCYSRYVTENNRTVVIAFDTVEAIRGMYLLLTLTQWMKALPRTLFILSGRPLPGGEHGQAEQPDLIKEELEDPHQQLGVETITLGRFAEADAVAYLETSSVATGLTGDEKAALVRLTRGHPLWLAFTVSYLAGIGMPEEADVSEDTGKLDHIRAQIPYSGAMPSEGQRLHEAFKRRLVTPYREADFWHEAIKRLAVVRQSVSQPIFEKLMADFQLPDDVSSPGDAWEQLLKEPWIRTRANKRYVTLHDAVAEELAQRIIPLHDRDQRWRKWLWRRAVDIYGELTEGPHAEADDRLERLNERMQRLDERLREEGSGRPSAEEESAFIGEVASADAAKRELDQLRAVRLHYQLLNNFDEGCRQFIEIFDRAKDDHEVLFEDRLALEMQRFLPAGVHPYAFGDVIGKVIDEFRDWIRTDGRAYYLQIGLRVADYLIENEQTRTVLDMLDRLPIYIASPTQKYELDILRGNAYMRTPGRVREGKAHFEQALIDAQTIESADRQSMIANAYNELGFYYRNAGMWREADEVYEQARDAILENLAVRERDEDIEQMASIQTNWAYIKGLWGSYRDAENLVESAITVRQRLNKAQAEGFSWSVRGEVYRYERRFETAWESYKVAERIFQGQRNWTWLGLIYQEQAICLFQASDDGINILPPDKDPYETARRLVTYSMDLCRDQAVRGYPSALNRAGRIFGRESPDLALTYLDEGIDQARRLSDGWFWFANLIEYAELSYRTYAETGEQRYRDEITRHEGDLRQVMAELAFPDLRGRWLLLQGHLGIHDWIRSADDDVLAGARDSYIQGFRLLADAYVGSSGAAAIPGEFRRFTDLFRNLPKEVQADWRRAFRRAWSQLSAGSTRLLARLEELY